MGKRKPRLTLKEHQEAARVLYVARWRLIRLALQFGNAFPRDSEGGRAAARIKKALKAVDEARDRAEEQLFIDHPDDATIDVYYGGRPEDIEMDVAENG